MTDLQPRPLGGTSLRVTPLCLGGSGLGSMPGVFGYDVDFDRAVATIRAALDSPINFLDTSAGYSDGESERRYGAALRAHGGLPSGFVLATKVDPDPATGDFSGAQVRKSAAESMERLGLDSFQLLHLHDPERIGFDAAMAPGGPVEALIELKREGVAQHIGVAGGPVDLLTQFVETGEFEVVLTHNRYTLLDRSADSLLDAATARGVAVLNAAPFGGGILAKGPEAVHKYAYREASPELLRKVEAMQELCRADDVPLAAAALQFSMRDPRIASTVVGLSTPERLDQTVRLATWSIPEDLWSRLEAVEG